MSNFNHKKFGLFSIATLVAVMTVLGGTAVFAGVPNVTNPRDYVGGSTTQNSTVADRVTTFDSTYRSGATNIDTSTEGGISITEIFGQPGEYEATAQLDSRVFDTRAVNGAAPIGITWSGTTPSAGPGTYAMRNFAYNENIGLIGLNCDELGSGPPNCATTGDWRVFIDAITGEYHGWAWSDAVGWIAFNCDNAEINDCSGTGGIDFNVSEDVVGDPTLPRDVTGWAWNDGLGWIAFSCDSVGISDCDAQWDNGQGSDGTPGNDSVWVDAAGDYHGWAWNDNVGWISFDCNNTGTAPYDCASNSYTATRSAAGGQTRVRFWIASSQCPNGETDYPTCTTAGSWEYRGSNCAIGGTPYETTGSSGFMEIPPVCYANYWNDRYFRYRVEMCSFDDCAISGNTIRPTVEDVSINWLK